jgi:hypothetical protein
MLMLSRILRVVRMLFAGPDRSPTAELWCRPATVLALRNPERARGCVAGWR